MEENEFFRASGSGEDLTAPLGEASAMASAFRAELSQVSREFAATGRNARSLERGLSRGLQRAFTDLVVEGDGLSDVLDGLARSMIRSTYNAALRPVTDHLGASLAEGLTGLVGGILPFVDGAAFSAGRVTPFARGGVVSSPTHFPMREGLGLMGEAGPEAILPLARGQDGRLGVRADMRAGGGAAPTVVMNISTPDVASFARARGQVAQAMSRALARGQRNR